MIWHFTIQFFIYALASHFLLSCIVGLLVWDLMQITSFHDYWDLNQDLYIGWLFMLLALSLSVVVHVWEDFGLGIF